MMLRKISPSASMKEAPSSSSAPSPQSPSQTRSAGNIFWERFSNTAQNLFPWCQSPSDQEFTENEFSPKFGRRLLKSPSGWEAKKNL